jgi:hypothetical protein
VVVAGGANYLVDAIQLVFVEGQRLRHPSP